VRVAGLAVAVLLTATAVGGAEARRITLCADPSNLPFSSRGAAEPGFEVEIARAIAETVNAEFGVHWLPTSREVLALRQLDDGRCDLFMGVPLVTQYMDDKPRLIFSAPYYVMRQAIASPNIGAVRSFDDLRGKLVGVQAMTIGDHLVYAHGYNRKVYRNPG
jgi:ABC-type amino acid transport substrate-binding protein